LWPAKSLGVFPTTPSIWVYRARVARGQGARTQPEHSPNTFFLDNSHRVADRRVLTPVMTDDRGAIFLRIHRHREGRAPKDRWEPSSPSTGTPRERPAAGWQRSLRKLPRRLDTRQPFGKITASATSSARATLRASFDPGPLPAYAPFSSLDAHTAGSSSDLIRAGS
jgi:hypothetical protein